MLPVKSATLIIFILKIIACDSDSKISSEEYKGEKFPKQYLEVDKYKPTEEDLNYYIFKLAKVALYFEKTRNDTDINKSLGTFFTQAILKRLLQENGEKLAAHRQYAYIRKIITWCESTLSHYTYFLKFVDTSSEESEFGRLLSSDTATVYSIRDFNRKALNKWILNKTDINEYIEAFDDLSLPKEKYVELTELRPEKYFIQIFDSDTCLMRINAQPIPPDISVLRPCRRDDYCKTAMSTSPSISYTLSHRVVNLLLYRFTRRCYFDSAERDYMHLEYLCAHMYREAVYIARRGYFSRDLFMEHVALCALLGYEEMFRRNWFYEIASWSDDSGCLQEFVNFEINRTKLYTSTTTNKLELKKHRRKLKVKMNNPCHWHPMVLQMMMLAHAVRHAVNVLFGITSKSL